MFQNCLVQIVSQDVPHFVSPFEYPPVWFYSSLLAGNACIPVSYYWFIGGMICFWIFKLNTEILSFGFYIVNSECVFYLVVDISLAYSCHEMFLLLLLCNLERNSSFKIIFFDSDFIFVLLFAPGSSHRIAILSSTFPSL